MENENDLQEILNPDEVVPETTEVSEPETDELTKAQQLAQNYKIRAEKAEALNKSFKAQPKPEQKSDFSIKDIKALSDVHDDDMDVVIEYAKFKGVSVAEAKKTPIIKNLLREKEEERATALASATGPAKRGASKASDDSLLERVASGTLTDEEMERAAKARIEQKRKHT